MALLVVAAIAAIATIAAGSAHGATLERFALREREVVVLLPANAPAPGARALLVVLHGGMGNADFVRRSLQLDDMADKYGFVIAYLNGSPSPLAARMHTWNAGECCGPAQRAGVDDVGYITVAIRELERRYGVRADSVYGVGHSNGAMMTQRVMCETGVYRAAVAISGPLELAVASCPAARGKRILALHGSADENVPIAGGMGKGIAGVAFKSQADSQRVWQASGAAYTLWVVSGATHSPASLRAAMAAAGKPMDEAIVGFLDLASAR